MTDCCYSSNTYKTGDTLLILACPWVNQRGHIVNIQLSEREFEVLYINKKFFNIMSVKMNRVPTFKHFDSNSLACWEFVDPKCRGLHHFSKSSMAKSFAWRREKVFDKWDSIRASCSSGRNSDWIPCQSGNGCVIKTKCLGSNLRWFFRKMYSSLKTGWQWRSLIIHE